METTIQTPFSADRDGTVDAILAAFDDAGGSVLAIPSGELSPVLGA